MEIVNGMHLSYTNSAFPPSRVKVELDEKGPNDWSHPHGSSVLLCGIRTLRSAFPSEGSFQVFYLLVARIATLIPNQ